MAVNNRIREAIAQTPPCAMRASRPRIRKLEDTVNGFIDLVEEGPAEAKFAIVVEVLSRNKLIFRLRMKRKGHFL
jgi:hypothetical protein